MLRLPQEEIDRLYPTVFGKLSEEGKTIIAISQRTPEQIADNSQPYLRDIELEVGPDKNTLQFQYPVDLRSSSNPNAKIKFKKSYAAFTQTDRDAFKDQGYYDTYDFYNIPKGTIIIAPVDGFLVLSINETTDKNGERIVVGGFIDFQAPNNGNIYRVGITHDFDTFKVLLDAPDFNSEYHNHKPIGTYGTPVKKGQKLFQTTANRDRISLTKFAADKYKEGEQIYVPTNIEFFVSPDNQLIASD